MSINSYIDEQQIQTRISEMAIEIDNFCRSQKIDELRLLCVLRGSVHFFSDLTRKIQTECRYDFIGLSSYGSQTTSSGNVQLTYPLPSDLQNKHVLVIEDIVDTGHSMHFLLQLLKEQKPAHIQICSLLSKPSRRQIEIPIDYLGFEIEDVFVVGYGLDFNGKYRSLSYIGIVS